MSVGNDYVKPGPSITGSIWRYRFVVLICATLATVAGYLLSKLQPEVYVASATLTLRDPGAPGVLSSGGGTPGVDLDRLAQQQAMFLASRAVLDTAAEQLDMNVQVLEDAVEAESDPEVALITVTASGRNGEDAATRANTVVESYQAIARDRNRHEVELANSVFQKQIKQLRKEERDLQGELEGVDIEDRDPLIESHLQSLRGEISAMQAQMVELAANGAVYGSGINAIEQALPSQTPASPAPVRDAAVFGAIGFGLASAFAYWRSGRSQRIETRVDAASVLNIPLLGEIPRFKGSGSLRGGELVLGGEASEAYEFVLSSIEFALAEVGGTSILITSASPGDGKTVTALHVAMAAAQESRRVRLVDTDLRAHGLTSLLRAERRPGLVQLAAGEVSLEDCIRPYRLSDTALLDVVPAGVTRESSISLLRSPEFKGAIEHIRRNSKLAILDSAPLLAVADATVIAAQVDAIVLVVDSGTQVDQLQKMRERLTFVPTPLLGYIYNRADTSRPARYGYGSRLDGRNGHRRLRPATASVSGD